MFYRNEWFPEGTSGKDFLSSELQSLPGGLKDVVEKLNYESNVYEQNGELLQYVLVFV